MKANKIIISRTLSLVLAGLFTLVLSTMSIAQNGVGVNTTTPKSNFEINGSFGQKVTAITTTTTLDSSHNTIVCNNGETEITLNLPAVSTSAGRVYIIKKGSSTAAVTLDANASETIEGASTYVLTQSKAFITIFNDGTEWKANSSSSSTSAWNLSGNTGTDSASNFIGTVDAQALVLKTNNTERVHITKAGETIIGGTTNHTKFEADGTRVMEGDATVWDDITVFPDATTKNAIAPPVYEQFQTNGASSVGVYMWMFEPNKEQDLLFSVQIPHKYKEGTNLKPHLHWTTITGTPSGTDVVWGLEYTATTVGGTFTTTTILRADTVISEIGTPSGTRQHLISSFGDISGSTLGISSIVYCRLFRIGLDSKDTFNYNTGLLSVDFHYEMDTEGSRTPFSK